MDLSGEKNYTEINEYVAKGTYDIDISFSGIKSIIDKHIGKAESKIHCNCSDEEIAKSFIEDCCEAQGHLWADNNIFEDVEESQ